ncbi:unnamed protein product [Caenorhabditis angaria]|uniref:Uncharacterized protein n=1 Tax=Caenorhabditis angaria TaxID=860376 RepID=A0A9P1N487_9PELO|nr:unnamed protein product [Caenorhabditis angaria]
MKILIPGLILICVLISQSSAELFGITIRGKVLCEKKPVEIELKLHEFDTVIDDSLDFTISNSKGEFEVSGNEDEIGELDPFIEISHNCTQKPGCYQRSRFYYKTSETNKLLENEVLNLEDRKFNFWGPICD